MMKMLVGLFDGCIVISKLLPSIAPKSSRSPPPTLEVPEKREGAVPLVLVLVVLVTLEALCFGS